MPAFVYDILNLLAVLFVFALGLLIVVAALLFIADISQTRDAVRRNYPLIGRFRALFTHLGEFFRQYFFAMDREELPFNRAQRQWVDRAAKNKGNTVAFGSTRNMKVPGTVIFSNCAFPDNFNAEPSNPGLVIGPGCREPYGAPSFFNISAMSYGSLSAPAIRALSKGAKIAGCWLNTGEGGIAPHHLIGGCDIVFQIGTAKYGVRNADGALDFKKLREVCKIPQIKMFELKLAQGAKPGKGGILPGKKVTQEIAAIRGIPIGQDSLSPNRHSEAGTLVELLDLVAQLKSVAGKPVGIKFVVGDPRWLDDLCTEISARDLDAAPDFFTVDGGDGGTGAAPMPLMDNVGQTVREGLPLASDALTHHGLKDRIRLIASGKLVTPCDVAFALATGADFVSSARGFMFSLGCIQALKCNQNSCPTGITTHDPRLQKGLDPTHKSQRVAGYHRNMVEEVKTIAHSCGAALPRDLARHHMRLVQPDGRSENFDRLYPEPEQK